MGKNGGVVFAWIMLIILFSFLGFITYVKYYMKIEKNTPEPTPIVTLDYLLEKFNNSTLLNDLKIDGNNIIANKSNDKIIISYTSDEVNVNYDVLYKQDVISISMANNGIELSIGRKIYVALIDIIAQYYKYSEGEILETAWKFINQNKSVNGLSVDNVNQNLVYKVDVAKKLVLYTPANTYTSFTLIDINSFDYYIIMDDYKISDVTINNNTVDNTLVLNGNVTNNLNNVRSAKLTFKLYDKENVLKETEKLDINFSDVNINKLPFVIAIPYSNKLNYEMISKYSIEINNIVLDNE